MQSCKKAADMRALPVRKVYHMWGHWGRFNVGHSTQRCIINHRINAKCWSIGNRNKKLILNDIFYYFTIWNSHSLHYSEERSKIWNSSRRKVEHFCNSGMMEAQPLRLWAPRLICWSILIWSLWFEEDSLSILPDLYKLNWTSICETPNMISS